MVRIPYIKIPSVRVGSIVPTSNIGTGGATPAPPTPITYLTQWKIVGNSEVHGVGNLTSWKVSGNSVVDNNTILSCGDLGQDGKYHVKISNGVNVFDIALDAPLRKVNDVADTIEFPSSVEGKALVTRNLGSVDLGKDMSWSFSSSSRRMFSGTNIGCKYTNTLPNMLCSVYNTVSNNDTLDGVTGIATQEGGPGVVCVYDDDYNTSASRNDFIAHLQGVELVFELATPTTELIDVSPIAVSPTDTYTSENVVPFYAFEHTENKEIWSCGEYNPTDGKYHILVQPLGGSIADIALTEPLRKVDNVADTIEFPSDTEDKALVTRNLNSNTQNPLVAKAMAVDSKTCSIRVQGRTPIKDVLGINPNIMCDSIEVRDYLGISRLPGTFISQFNTAILVRNSYIEQTKEAYQDWLDTLGEVTFIYQLGTPTTELVDAPQIAEAESYACVISQGGKAVEWSSFETDSE